MAYVTVQCSMDPVDVKMPRPHLSLLCGFQPSPAPLTTAIIFTLASSSGISSQVSCDVTHQGDKCPLPWKVICTNWCLCRYYIWALWFKEVTHIGTSMWHDIYVESLGHSFLEPYKNHEMERGGRESIAEVWILEWGCRPSLSVLWACDRVFENWEYSCRLMRHQDNVRLHKS